MKIATVNSSLKINTVFNYYKLLSKKLIYSRHVRVVRKGRAKKYLRTPAVKNSKCRLINLLTMMS